MYLDSLSDSDWNILILEILSNIICRQMMTFASIIHLLFVTQASRATFFDGSYCYLQETMQLTSNDPSSYFSTTFSFNSFRNLLIIYQKLVNDYKIQETVYSSRSFIKVQGMEELKGITNAKLLKWVIIWDFGIPSNVNNLLAQLLIFIQNMKTLLNLYNYLSNSGWMIFY